MGVRGCIRTLHCLAAVLDSEPLLPTASLRTLLPPLLTGRGPLPDWSTGSRPLLYAIERSDGMGRERWEGVEGGMMAAGRRKLVELCAAGEGAGGRLPASAAVAASFMLHSC